MEYVHKAANGVSFDSKGDRVTIDYPGLVLPGLDATVGPHSGQNNLHDVWVYQSHLVDLLA